MEKKKMDIAQGFIFIVQINKDKQPTATWDTTNRGIIILISEK